ncbi:hypothetical protein E3E23_00745 [Thermococcus sp. CX2]|uniref:hypothetical protein n=1 Tax=Thermococcus sp. CX2 TaxID=163006 RepID=UPI00143C5A85|nr:hypothetical protein [Thermococcus sp. CX2]NJE84374.1 hypothetical protein [Thermococcus sp. CX2]
MEPTIYNVPLGKIREIFEGIEKYGIVGIDTENEASLLDDMLQSDKERLKYAREKLDDGTIDSALLVVKDGTGTLVVKMENIITIRVTVGDYGRLIEDFELKRRE